MRVRLMEALWARPQSAKELARTARVPPDRLYYHLDKLQKARLARVSEYRELRGGKVERVYAAAEQEPPGDEATPEEVTHFLEAVLEATRMDLHAAGARVRAGGRGQRSLSRDTLRLSPERFEELKQRLGELNEEFRGDPGGEDVVLVRLLWTLIELGGART